MKSASVKGSATKDSAAEAATAEPAATKKVATKGAIQKSTPGGTHKNATSKTPHTTPPPRDCGQSKESRKQKHLDSRACNTRSIRPKRVVPIRASSIVCDGR